MGHLHLIRFLWAGFIADAQKKGHKIYVVTMRYPSECENLYQFIKGYDLEVIATSRKAKKSFCEDMGIDIHVWIDDNPIAVEKDAAQIWPISAPEGQPIDVHYK